MSSVSVWPSASYKRYIPPFVRSSTATWPNFCRLGPVALHYTHRRPNRLPHRQRRAIQFIRHQARTDAPFYLQVTHYAIHLSAEAKPATLALHKARAPGKIHTVYWYAAMIDDLDQAVGRIFDVLDELQLTDYTYVFLTSDNGGTARQYPRFNKSLRAGKASY